MHAADALESNRALQKQQQQLLEAKKAASGNYTEDGAYDQTFDPDDNMGSDEDDEEVSATIDTDEISLALSGQTKLSEDPTNKRKRKSEGGQVASRTKRKTDATVRYSLARKAVSLMYMQISSSSGIDGFGPSSEPSEVTMVNLFVPLSVRVQLIHIVSSYPTKTKRITSEWSNTPQQSSSASRKSVEKK